jgi:hypothetical protein
VETGLSLVEVLVGLETVVEFSSEPESTTVPVVSAADEVRVLLPLETPVSKSVLSLLSLLVVRVLPLLLPDPVLDAAHASMSSWI